MTEVQLATIMFAAPFLILASVWLIGLVLLFKPARVRNRRRS